MTKEGFKEARLGATRREGGAENSEFVYGLVEIVNYETGEKKATWGSVEQIKG